MATANGAGAGRLRVGTFRGRHGGRSQDGRQQLRDGLRGARRCRGWLDAARGCIAVPRLLGDGLIHIRRPDRENSVVHLDPRIDGLI